jgi:hypothetical protein
VQATPHGYAPSKPSSRSPWLIPAAVLAGLAVVLGIGGVWLVLRDGTNEVEATGDTVADPESTELESEAQPPPTEPTSEASDPSSSSLPATEDVTAAQLGRGDCIQIPVDSGIFDTVARLGCEEPHNGQVIGILEHPSAGGEYPGQEELSQYGYTFCSPIFEQYVGVDEFSTELISYGLTPTFDEWNDDGIFVVPCVASRWDYDPLTASVEGRSTDPAVSLDFGDAYPLHRSNLGACFVAAPGSIDGAIESLAGLAQVVELADCSGVHEGQIVGSNTLQGPEAYDYGALAAEAEPLCLEQFQLFTGLDSDETGGLISIVPDFVEWETNARYAICVLLNFDGGTGSAEATF